MDSAMLSFEEARLYGLALEPLTLKPPQEHSNHAATTVDSDMAILSFEEARFYGLALEPLTLKPPQEHSNHAATTVDSDMATLSFEEARFYGLPLEPLKAHQEHSNHASTTTTTTTTTTATTMDSDMATPSFEEARFYGLSLEQLTLERPQEQSNSQDKKFIIKATTMDSHIATPSFEEARFYGSAATVDSDTATPSFEEARLYGLSLEPLSLEPPQEHSDPKEKKCMRSSPSNQPLVQSPRYTSNNMVLLKTAMKNSMLKMGGKKAKFARKNFIIKRMPRQSLRPRRKAFQIRPSRLGPFVPVPPQCRVQ